MERALLGARASYGVVVPGEPQRASAMIRQDLSTSYQEVRTGRARRAGRAPRPPRRWMIGTPWHVGSTAGGAAAWSRHEAMTRDPGVWLWGKRLASGSSAAPCRPHGPRTPAALCLSPEPPASPRRAALALGPFCSSRVRLPRPCPASVSSRGAASLAVSHHCPGLIQAVQPPHTVRPCLTGAAHAQQLVSMAVSTEALATLETHCLQTS